MPKVITAILAGSALAIQSRSPKCRTIFYRISLAGPNVLGISSGAGLGVAVMMLGFSKLFSLSVQGFLGNWIIVISAWTGALALLLLIFTISIRIKDIMTILVIGILFGSVAGSLISIMQYFSTESMLKSFIVWTIGSFGGVSPQGLSVLFPCVLTGSVIAFLCSKNLNSLLLGEDYSKSMGSNIGRSRFLIFLSTGILTGSVTAFCGPIAFIGIVAPHITRMIFRTSLHNKLIVGSCLVGSILMITGDDNLKLPATIYHRE